MTKTKPKLTWWNLAQGNKVIWIQVHKGQMSYHNVVVEQVGRKSSDPVVVICLEETKEIKKVKMSELEARRK